MTIKPKDRVFLVGSSGVTYEGVVADSSSASFLNSLAYQSVQANIELNDVTLNKHGMQPVTIGKLHIAARFVESVGLSSK